MAASSLINADYIPWRRGTVSSNLPALKCLLDNSFYPDRPDDALDNPILLATHASLHSSAPCKICKMLAALTSGAGLLPSAFLEDYSLLCYFCLNAPISWSSGLIAAIEFYSILKSHFPDSLGTGDHFFHPTGILGPDIQMHFFLNKCFKIIKSDVTYVSSNLEFLKKEFLRAIVTGGLSTHLCFKTVWQTLNSSIVPTAIDESGKHLKKRQSIIPNCCKFVAGRPPPTAAQKSPSASTPRPGPPGGGGFSASLCPTADANNFIDIFWSVWRASSLHVKRPLKLLGCEADLWCYAYPEWADASQGPCLLSPLFCLKQKNNTFSVCVLCELLACHPLTKQALSAIKSETLNFVENNMRLLDRISFLMTDEEFLQRNVNDINLLELITACDPQEIYKHLFCDPLCLLNTCVTDPDIIYSSLSGAALQSLKEKLVLGEEDLLTGNKALSCDFLETLALLFKSTQCCKIQKTTFLEILKEVDLALSHHNLKAVQSVQTAQLYV